MAARFRDAYMTLIIGVTIIATLGSIWCYFECEYENENGNICDTYDSNDTRTIANHSSSTVCPKLNILECAISEVLINGNITWPDVGNTARKTIPMHDTDTNRDRHRRSE